MNPSQTRRIEVRMRRLFVLLAFLAASPAAGADFSERRGNLISLSRIFGELHHLRRICDYGDEFDVWRDRMKRMLDLEQPPFELREAMIGAFNEGYGSAQVRFGGCDGGAEDYAASRAATGEAIVSGLTDTLNDPPPTRSAENPFGIEVVRGGDGEN